MQKKKMIESNGSKKRKKINICFFYLQIKKTLRSKHPSLKRKQDKDKDIDHVMSSSSDQLTSNTHTTALVPVTQTVYVS